MTYAVRFGSGSNVVSFGAEKVEVLPFDQPLERIATGEEIARSSRKGVQQYFINDLSGGLLVDDNDILNISNVLRYAYNEGLVTRVSGALLLPEVVTNQSSMTNDENSSAFHTANKRLHSWTSSVGSTVGEQAYFAAGQRFFKLNTSTGAVEVASCNVDAAGASTTLPGIVTCMAELQVAGATVLAIALKDYGVVYTSDPDAATVTFTECLDGSSDSYIYAMRHLQTIGPGVNVFCGNADGTNGFWWVDGSDSAPFTVKRLVLASTKDDSTLQGDLLASSEEICDTGASDSSDGGTVWTNPGNVTADDATDATCVLPAAGLSEWLKCSGFSTIAGEVAASDFIEGIIVRIEQGSTVATVDIAEVQLRLSGTRIGLSKQPNDNGFTDAAVYELGKPLDSWGPTNLHGSDLANIEVWVRVGTSAAATAAIDYVSLQVTYRETGVERTWVEGSSPSPDLTDGLNILADDSNFGSGSTTIGDFFSIFSPGQIPSTTPIEEVLVEAVLSCEDQDASDSTVSLLFDGTTYRTDALTGLDIAAGTGNLTDIVRTSRRFEIALSGSNGDLVGSQAHRLEVQWTLTGAALVAGDVQVYYVHFHASYRQSKGTMASLPLGGYMVTPNPVTPNRITVTAPVSDEEITRLLPREIWNLDFSWDATDNRVLMSISQPNEGMVNVHHAVPFLGGTLLTGDNTTGPGQQLHHISSSGQLFVYNFPKAYGSYTPKIAWLMPGGGIWAILGVAMYNSSSVVADFQIWYFNGNNLRFYTDTPLQSVTNNLAIAVEPFAMSTAFYNPLLNYIYTFFPNSTTTAVRRERIHTDLSADPRLDNPTWVKQMSFSSGTENTRMKLRMLRMNYGPEEAEKSVTNVRTTSTQLDDNTSYGSALFEIDVNGDTALATPDVTNVFDSALESYDVPSGGVAYVSMIKQISLGHEAGSAETPNGLGWVVTTKQKWPRGQVYRVTTSKRMLGKYRDVRGLLAAIDTLTAAKVTQPLYVGTDGTESGLQGVVLASFERIEGIEGQPVGFLDLMSDDPFVLTFLKIPGKVAS